MYTDVIIGCLFYFSNSLWMSAYENVALHATWSVSSAFDGHRVSYLVDENV